MKNKIVAAFLALFAGMFGVHRFYLQRWWQGVMYMALSFITIMITADGEGPAFLIPMVLGFVDALLFFVMPKEDFDEKYNKKRLQQTQQESYYDEAESEADPAALMEKPLRSSKVPPSSKAGKREMKKEDFFKRSGIEQFRRMDFEGAIDSFLKALEDNITSPSVHFNLACCYSMVENTEKALQNLEKAIENGFSDISKIQSHKALAHLRKQPEFESFVANGYRIIKQLPEPQPNLLDNQSNAAPKDVLDEVLHLGDLREKGLITEEEFVAQKRKLLS